MGKRPCDRADGKETTVCVSRPNEMCRSCGRNPAVAEARKARIDAGEMVRNSKGLKYLPLHDGL